MKVLLAGKTIEDESVTDAVLRILGDKSSRNILESIMDTPKSVQQISLECEIPLVLVYKKLQRLKDYNLVKIAGAILEAGKKYQLFSSKTNSIMIIINGKYPSQTVVLDSGDLIQCISCDSADCGLYYDERYNGVRGKCDSCNTNWPES